MNLDRITTLLASGLKAANVASIVGCSPARITQLLSVPENKLLLDSKIAEFDQKDVEEVAISNKYNAAEHVLLNQIIDMAPVSDLRDVVGALRVVADRQDKAKTRLNPVQASTIINQVISIQVPNHSLPEIILNKEGEVTSVNSLNLAPLTSEGVTNLFKTMRSNRDEKIKERENEQRRIPEFTEGFTSETTSTEISEAFIKPSQLDSANFLDSLETSSAFASL